MFRLAREGYPFILVFASISLITVFWGIYWVAVATFLLMLFMLFFFRDPDRSVIEDRRSFYSPADGRVILIQETVEDELLQDRALEISIFMSPFDVHVNRVPCNGVVRAVRHYPGRFISAFKKESSRLNEHITMLLESEYGNIVIRQVAGLLARRAVCRVRPGDSLRQGQRYGIIKFSSRVDVYLPMGTKIKVRLNEKVKAGETILGIVEEKAGQK
jgi:phosphatidylserine decarboxylase